MRCITVIKYSYDYHISLLKTPLTLSRSGYFGLLSGAVGVYLTPLL